jgi:crotonobetaine/carnitine-CoA ligase
MDDAACPDIALRERTVGARLARLARERADQPFLLFEGERHTYAEVERLTNRLANGLLAAGLGRGEHVALIVGNRPELLWAYFALGKIGAVSVPMNVAAKGELLAGYLVQSGSGTLVIEAALLERFEAVRERVPGIRRLVVMDADAADAARLGARLGLEVLPWAAASSDRDEPPPVEVAFRDPFLIMFTSGTTGPSKGSISPHAYAVTYGLQRAQCFGYRASDVLYTCLPLFHGNALIGTCFSALAAGATVALSRRFSASAFWQELRDCGATQVNLLGAMANFLWSRPEEPGDRAHRVRQCTMVPLPDFAAGFEARFGLKLTSVYALSDYGMGTMLGPDHPPEKWRSAGVPAPGVDVAILDDDDVAVPEGEVGEIALRARTPWTVGQGYWRMPEATVEAWRNLWFHTGDRGYLDADGYLYFVDRKKDAIRRRGENISSWEVERVVQRHPAVLDVAAFPVRAGLPEDEVMVSVVLRPGAALSPEALIAHCNQDMAYFMVPRFVEFVAALPRTMTEKVEKYRLRADAEARLDALWDRERAGIRVSR